MRGASQSITIPDDDGDESGCDTSSAPNMLTPDEGATTVSKLSTDITGTDRIIHSLPINLIIRFACSGWALHLPLEAIEHPPGDAI